MDTIANNCKIIKKANKNQIKSDLNASMIGEKLLMDIFPALDGFFIASCDCSPTEIKMVLISIPQFGIKIIHKRYCRVFLDKGTVVLAAISRYWMVAATRFLCKLYRG